MPSLDYVSRSLHGAYRLMRGDPQGLRSLDLSVGGFWRSFGAILLVLPLQLLMIVAERDATLEASAHSDDTFPSGAFIVTRLVGLGLDWIDYPIVLALLAPLLGITRRYVPLIVALNWASPIAMVPAVVPSLLYEIGFVGGGAAAGLQLLVTGLLVWLQFVVTRIALMTPVAVSIGLVFLDIAVSLLVISLFDRVLGF